MNLGESNNVIKPVPAAISQVQVAALSLLLLLLQDVVSRQDPASLCSHRVVFVAYHLSLFLSASALSRPLWQGPGLPGPSRRAAAAATATPQRKQRQMEEEFSSSNE